VLDIYFVVDISKSINEKELAQERLAIRTLIGSFDVGKDKSRVGLIKYHHFDEQEFPLGKYATHEELSAIDILTRGKIKGGTRTDLGMLLMVDKFKKEGKAGHRQVAILLTDGKATADLDDMISALEKTDITAIAVGVGALADKQELASIATGDGMTNVYSAVNFDDLKAIAREIVKQACTGGER